MTFSAALILAVVQGLTEFLPVSSSGHLAVLQNLFGMEEPPLFFDLTLHLGTLVAVIVLYRRELWEVLYSLLSPDMKGTDSRLLGRNLLVSFAVTSAVALPLEKLIGESYSDSRLIAVFLLVSAALVVSTGLLTRSRDGSIFEMTLWGAVIVGLAQGLAPFPGISRSGITILAAVAVGLRFHDALRYSFFLAVPTIGAAFLYGLMKNSADFGSVPIPQLLAGFMISGLTGMAAIRLLTDFIRPKIYYWFAVYLLIIVPVVWLMAG